jgi:hypothetical protein
MGVLGFGRTPDRRPRQSTNGRANWATRQPACERTRDGLGYKGFLRDGKARRGQRQTKRDSGHLQHTHPVLSYELERREDEPLISLLGR